MSVLGRRTLIGVATAIAVAMTSTTYAATQVSSTLPLLKTPKFAAAIEGFAPYQPQTLCDPTEKPGVVKFRALLLATYPFTHDDGITRACGVGGRSEHKEGRAWDWAVSVKNPRDVRTVHKVFDWLFATDAHGNRDAMLRRLGIMYIIWNKRIWEPSGGGYSYNTSGAAGGHWSVYHCHGFTACHKNHVHFSFGWAGALGKTSFWTHKVSPVLPAPAKILLDKKLPRTVHVDASNVDWWTPFALQKQHHYLLTVTGTASRGWDGTSVFDAVCAQHEDLSWRRWVENNEWSDPRALNLVVNGHSKWMPVTDDGNNCNSVHHTYVLHFTPHVNGRWHVFVRDLSSYDANGTFTLKIARDWSITATT